MSARAEPDTGHLPATMPRRTTHPPRVRWTGVLARINVPYDDAASIPVMLRGAAGRNGERVPVSAGRWPIPLVYPYPPDHPDPYDTGSALIPRVGGAAEAWIAPAPGGLLALYGAGTATGDFGRELLRGRRITVHADVTGAVSLVEHRGVTVIVLDQWRLCKIVAHRSGGALSSCCIWSTDSQGVTQ